MILILSEHGDKTTDLVIDWLHFYGIDFYRINWEDFYKDISLSIRNDVNTFISKQLGSHKISDFNVVWYRKWFYSLNYENAYITDKKVWNTINKSISNEVKALDEYFIYLLRSNCKVVGLPSEHSFNKLIQLKVAAECGLVIPATDVTTNHLSMRDNSKQLITKAISDNIGIEVENNYFITYTNKVNHCDLYDSNGFPSLFQENIKKRFEIRTFFFKSNIFSMAIFSQDNEKTMVDFRRYDNKEPNRNVPFKLPKEIEGKLIKFTHKIGLESGSFDLLRADDEFIFLEVNPLGQLGMVSRPCNYQIEQVIANELIKCQKK